MTNKEWMSTLTAEQFYDAIMWLVRDYGFRFNNTRLAIITWLDEPHEAEPTHTKVSNALNVLDCVEERKKGEWDMFDLISSAYYGKGMYFKQDNGTVYSRHSGEYMTVDEAIREFISLIDEENIAYVPSVTTVWADGEAPTYVQLKKGKWLKKHDKISYWHECSECGEKAKTNSHFNIILSNFCPNCGAKMREES